MTTKIIEGIDNITISYKSTKELIKEDNKLFEYLKPKKDTEIANNEEYSDFIGILQVFNRPLHFKNLFNYYSVVKFILNEKQLIELNPTIEMKKELQQALIRLSDKMYDVYNKKINSQNGSWNDEYGIIQGSIGRMKISIDNMSPLQ